MVSNLISAHAPRRFAASPAPTLNLLETAVQSHLDTLPILGPPARVPGLGTTITDPSNDVALGLLLDFLDEAKRGTRQRGLKHRVRARCSLFRPLQGCFSGAREYPPKPASAPAPVGSLFNGCFPNS